MMQTLKQAIKSLPLTGPLAIRLRRLFTTPATFPGSAAYWDERYRQGGHSGHGSRDQLASFKAGFLNDFVRSRQITSVIEFGCGDGNQLRLAQYPAYLGLDVSPTAVARCRRMFADDRTKQFCLLGDGPQERADLTLSLDVIYHLIEDAVFESHMSQLFDMSTQYVIIYASNTNRQSSEQAAHIRHRKFSDWIATNRPDWHLLQHVPNPHPYRGDDRTGSFADFFVYALVPCSS